MSVAHSPTVEQSVDHLFRRHAGRMVSVLTRIFGFEKLDLIEDAVQDALVTALRKWPYTGMPDNPTAWLIQVSKNRVLDHLRANKKFQTTEEDLETVSNAIAADAEEVYFSNEVSEDQLRMIFACCHPVISPDSQVALTLKTVCGFNIPEIARAFLSTDYSIAKLISRAKQRLRLHGVRLGMPLPGELKERLESVLKVLYLMFNEGYTASAGDELIRKDLCFEAIRFGESLAKHPVTTSPEVHALATLFLAQAARFSTRCDNTGELLLLSEQDRSLWDRQMMDRALQHFRLSASGEMLSDYHLEAEIAVSHTFAKDYASTDWRNILECYDALQKRRFSPVVELNRIVVLAEIEGAESGLVELENFRQNYDLNGSYLLDLTEAHFLSETGAHKQAVESYTKALNLTENRSIRRFLEKKINELKTSSAN